MPSSTKRPSISLEELDLVLGPPRPILKDHVRASEIALRRITREDLMRRKQAATECRKDSEDIASVIATLKSRRSVESINYEI